MTFTLIRTAAIVTMDEAVPDPLRAAVLVDGDGIAEIAPTIEPPPGAEVIEAAGMTAAPAEQMAVLARTALPAPSSATPGCWDSTPAPARAGPPSRSARSW